MDVSSVSSVLVPTLFVVGITVVWLWRKTMAESPGPTPFPLVGNIPQVVAGKMDFDRKLLQLRERFGDFFRLNLGDMTTLFAFGLKNVSEILIQQGENFCNRPSWLYIPDKVIGRKGLIWTNGETWKQIRSLVVNAQHNSSSASHIEMKFLSEVEELCRQLKQEDGKLINPRQYFRSFAFQAITLFIFGERFDDEDFRYMLESIDYLTQNNKTQTPINMFPKMACFMKSKHASAIEKEAEVLQFISQKIEEHKAAINSAHTKDLIDIYLTERNKMSEDDQKGIEKHFLRTVIDLYIYGYEMCTSLFLWSVAMMVQYPDVQRKCHDEIEATFPNIEKPVSRDDRIKLPYFSATLNEIIRMYGPGIMTTPHEATEDTVVGGFKVKRNQLVVCDLLQPRFDDEEWTNPHEFSPERFTNSSSDLTDRPAYSVFGLGPRKCPAQKLAQDMQFLMTVNLLRHFHINKGDNVAEFKVTSEYKGLSYKPKDFYVVFKSKHREDITL